jgi:hypothetical protein
VREKPIVGSPFFGAFSSDCTPKATKISTYISLFTVAIRVNYASEFRKHSEAATYILIAVN